MKRLAAILIVVAALLVFPAAPSQAQRGHGAGGHSGGHGAWHGGGHGGGWHGYGGWRGGIFIGAPYWWWDPLFFPYPYAYPYSYYPPPYYGYPSMGEQDQPSVYVEQESEPPPAPPEIYWYYCPSAKAYYPTVKKCREAWVKVPPRPE